MSAIGNLLYHSVDPEAKKSSYSEFDTIDFVINVGEGRALVKNSIRFVGTLKVHRTGTTAATNDVYLNHKIGIHAVCDSWTTSFSEGPKVGVVENLQNYGRLVSAISSATDDIMDLNKASRNSELRAPSSKMAEVVQLQRETTFTTGTQVQESADFSMKPHIALNRVEGANISFSKTGVVRVSLNLAKNLSALEGGLAGSVANYALEDIRLTFNSMEDMDKGQCLMRTAYSFKSAVLSSSANISARVPAVANAVSVTYQRQDRESVNVFSNYQLENPRNFKSIQFLFNNATNQYISYKIEDNKEALERGLDALVSAGHNQVVNPGQQGRNRNCLHGLDFAGMVDLTQQRFTVQLESDIDAQNPYNIFLYFHGMLAL